MYTTSAKERRRSAILHVRLDEGERQILQLIADAETKGNVSELVRKLARERLAERTRRRRSGALKA